jgi:hypothetical protein
MYSSHGTSRCYLRLALFENRWTTYSALHLREHYVPRLILSVLCLPFSYSSITLTLSSFYSSTIFPLYLQPAPILSACVSHWPPSFRRMTTLSLSLPEPTLIGFQVQGLRSFAAHRCPAGPLLALASVFRRRMPKQDPLGGYSGLNESLNTTLCILFGVVSHGRKSIFRKDSYGTRPGHGTSG